MMGSGVRTEDRLLEPGEQSSQDLDHALPSCLSIASEEEKKTQQKAWTKFKQGEHKKILVSMKIQLLKKYYLI